MNGLVFQTTRSTNPEDFVASQPDITQKQNLDAAGGVHSTDELGKLRSRETLVTDLEEAHLNFLTPENIVEQEIQLAQELQSAQ